MKYRGDIDGLRAVAVVPVVLFHAGVAGLSGGFIGVDVFFVISGYLISSIIASEIGDRRFSLARFYERRARRILPAFASVGAVTAVVAFIILLPADLVAFGRSLAAAFLSGSNVLFWLESGDYFAANADLKPLLHTWSLGVEEQFYVVFPLVLMGLHAMRGWGLLRPLVWAGIAVSLALAVYGVREFNIATFYLLPTRAWELLAGTALAVGCVPAFRSRVQAEFASGLGLLLIVAGIVLYDKTTPFPGLAAIPPALGAALVIHAGATPGETVVAKLLSRPLPRLIGLISFSLYLWHWPLLVFARYMLIEPAPWVMALMVVAAFGLAWLSWRFVERPFRHSVKGGSALRPLVAAVSVIVVGAGAGWALDAGGGFPQRMPAEIVKMSEKKTYQGPHRDCGLAYDRHRTVETLCILGAAGVDPDILVVGDSHADAMAASVFEAAASVGRSGYQISATGYRPVLGYEKHGEREKYAYLNALVIQLLNERPQISDIVVVPYWHGATAIDEYVDSKGLKVDGATAMGRGLTALVAKYPDKRFLIVGATANSPSFGGQAAARAAMFRPEFTAEVPLANYLKSRTTYSPILDNLGRRPNVEVLELWPKTCDRSICPSHTDGISLYSDDNHLSYAASQLFLNDFRIFLSRRTARGAP